MVNLVSYDSIEDCVVRDWFEYIKMLNNCEDDDVYFIVPFYPLEFTVFDVLYEVNICSVDGFDFYRRMVIDLPEYDFMGQMHFNI